MAPGTLNEPRPKRSTLDCNEPPSGNRSVKRWRGMRATIPKTVDGGFPAKQYAGLNSRLEGVEAFNAWVVREWHEWLLTSYKPRFNAVLVTPCSNVKPYPLSPTSRKIAGMFRRLGLWNGFAPYGIEWLYLSDLLVLVPYWRAWDYPACCYELPPDIVLRNERLFWKVASILAGAVERLVDNGVEAVIVYLPRRHLRLWVSARRVASVWPWEVYVKYSIFSTRELEYTVKKIVGLGAG